MMAGVSSSESPVAPGAPLGQSLMTRGPGSFTDAFCWLARAGDETMIGKAKKSAAEHSVFEIIREFLSHGINGSFARSIAVVGMLRLINVLNCLVLPLGV